MRIVYTITVLCCYVFFFFGNSCLFVGLANANRAAAQSISQLNSLCGFKRENQHHYTPSGEWPKCPDYYSHFFFVSTRDLWWWFLGCFVWWPWLLAIVFRHIYIYIFLCRVLTAVRLWWPTLRTHTTYICRDWLRPRGDFGEILENELRCIICGQGKATADPWCDEKINKQQRAWKIYYGRGRKQSLVDGKVFF